MNPPWTSALFEGLTEGLASGPGDVINIRWFGTVWYPVHSPSSRRPRELFSQTSLRNSGILTEPSLIEVGWLKLDLIAELLETNGHSLDSH